MAGKKSVPKKAAPKKVNVAPSPKLTAEDKRWRARDDLRTLQAAHEIQSDKGRVTAAQREAAAQMQALAKVGKPNAKT